MMGWGRGVLEWVAGKGPCLQRDAFFQTYGFFRTTLNPWGHAYLFSQVLQAGQGSGLTPSEYFRGRFEPFAGDLVRRPGEIPLCSDPPTYTHLLPLDRAFLDFLRLSCGIKRVSLKEAVSIKAMVDREIEGFTKDFLRKGRWG
jgi:hypothetical protein